MLRLFGPVAFWLLCAFFGGLGAHAAPPTEDPADLKFIQQKRNFDVWIDDTEKALYEGKLGQIPFRILFIEETSTGSLVPFAVDLESLQREVFFRFMSIQEAVSGLDVLEQAIQKLSEVARPHYVFIAQQNSIIQYQVAGEKLSELARTPRPKSTPIATLNWLLDVLKHEGVVAAQKSDLLLIASHEQFLRSSQQALLIQAKSPTQRAQSTSMAEPQGVVEFLYSRGHWGVFKVVFPANLVKKRLVGYQVITEAESLADLSVEKNSRYQEQSFQKSSQSDQTPENRDGRKYVLVEDAPLPRRNPNDMNFRMYGTTFYGVERFFTNSKEQFKGTQHSVGLAYRLWPDWTFGLGMKKNQLELKTLSKTISVFIEQELVILNFDVFYENEPEGLYTLFTANSSVNLGLDGQLIFKSHDGRDRFNPLDGYVGLQLGGSAQFLPYSPKLFQVLLGPTLQMSVGSYQIRTEKKRRWIYTLQGGISVTLRF